MSLPQIPECDVELTADGRLRITHRPTGDAELAETEEQAVIKGVILRVAAAFRTGDLR
ncbi:hypothetical protein ABT294_00440 [Nonomuraea sp. NPDC000554]|uniref:hypothetical protein n=1 Tax=Nonomuraea sp. NPDC000554 TaxID=3154259 RepID=UPI00333155B8